MTTLEDIEKEIDEKKIIREKLIVSVDPQVMEVLVKMAGERGIGVSEYMRCCVVPDWIQAHIPQMRLIRIPRPNIEAFPHKDESGGP